MNCSTLFISCPLAIPLSIPNPQNPNALPIADVSQFSSIDIELTSPFFISLAYPVANSFSFSSYIVAFTVTSFSVLSIISVIILPFGFNFLNANILSLTSAYFLPLMSVFFISEFTFSISLYSIL